MVSKGKAIKISLVLFLSISIAMAAYKYLIPRRVVMGAFVTWTYDISNEWTLSAHSENIFVGEVIAREGTVDRSSPIIATKFRVKVLDNIKGEMAGAVMVSQWGGYKGNTLYVSSIDGMVDELMEVGGIYLLLTNKKGNVHGITPLYGKIKINSEREKIKLIEKYKGFAKIK